jgi:alkaline phosphatase D
MDPQNVAVSWEVASDDSMRNIVRRGKAISTANLAHSVHVEVDGLAPDRWYWYRFRAGDAESPIGRTRTLPMADATPAELKLAFASCQHYESGLYTAYEHMAEDDPDLVFHLGDYIYEGAAKDGLVRKHVNGECVSLTDYRLRHSQYKTDPLLQAMHGCCPWVVTWDDHEVDNDYANDAIKGNVDPAKFLIRRAAAYQAYYEMMPLRRTSLPRGPKMQIYRRLPFGQLANFLVLDGRQYRTRQPNNDEPGKLTDECLSDKGTMLGNEQYQWLEKSLTESSTAWNVLAQQTIMAVVDMKEGPDQRYGRDLWCGYISERNRIMKLLHERQVANPIVITGDNHSNWANNLRVDDLDSESPIAAAEFVGTSISSGGNGGGWHDRERYLKAENSGVQFYNNERGYVRCTLTPKQWTTEFRTVPEIKQPGGEVVTRATYVVQAGEPGTKRA